MNTLNNTYNYNDLASLNSITRMSNTEEGEAEALKQVARQFESMFVGMMLKSMRDANSVFEEDNPLNSNESKFYRQMFDDQLALSMTQGKGIGLADNIYRQLSKQFDVSIPNEDGQLERKTSMQGLNKAQNTVNNFSTLNPSLDLMQFNQKNKVEALNAEPSLKSQSINNPPTTRPVLDQVEEPGVSDVPVSVPVLTPENAIKENTPSAAFIEMLNGAKGNAIKIDVNSINEKSKQTSAVESNKKPETTQLGPIKKSSGFETPQDFVDTLWPIAQKIGADMGVEPKAIISQAALETGWGKYIIHQGSGQNSHNLFGIKADQRWQGDVAKVSTLEYRGGIAKKEVAPFRVYESYEHSLRDYGEFVKNSDRYSHAMKNGHSIEGYSQGLQNGGYATDPKYAEKIQRIAGGQVLNEAIKNSAANANQQTTSKIGRG